MENINKIKADVKSDHSILVGCLEITDTVTGYTVFVGIGEILDSLSDSELQKLLVRIENKRAYKQTVVE